MNIRNETKLINLTSESATQKINSSYLSNILFFTPGLLIYSNKILDIQLSLVHAEIPVSFYNVNYTNCNFKYKLGSGAIFIVTVPVGNYNFNSLSAALSLLITDINFTIVINKTNGILTFSYNTSFQIYTDNPYSIAAILGFDISNNVYTSTSNIITCSYPLNLLGIKKLNITSNLNSTNYSTGLCCSTLISTIPVSEPAFGLITYQNQNGISCSILDKEINKINIQITDETNNFINFNNINWSILLSLTITYNLDIETNYNLGNIKELPKSETKPEPNETNSNIKELDFLTN